MRSTKRKTIADFEQTHGQPKIAALKRSLDAERAKVDALSGVQNRVKVETRIDCCLRFALTGDRHYGSLYHHADALQSFYAHMDAEGVDTVYDAGDIMAGHRVYKGQEFELRDLGFEAQLDRVRKSAPVTKARTCFITGNHDASFKNAAGVPVGRMIAETVPGYEFLGEEQATIRFETPNGPFALRLIHPGGGSSYALSYRPQKIIESIGGGEKPNMLAIGHYHKAELMPSYRNVCGVQTGTFERQTPFMARQGLAAHVGGWVVEVHVGDGHNRIKAEFIAFYV
jgi:hypothetical protein